MQLTSTPATAASTSPGDVPPSNKHCIFRCGESWFSMPAVAVREIVIAPELVQLPNCHRALVGLGHLRSEFVPVIELSTLLDMDQSATDSAVDCLLVLQGSCSWSLLISESNALESLETIVSPEARGDSSNNVVIGTAMYRNRIVRVLNPNGLLTLAQRAFEQYWLRSNIAVATSNS